ncbi:glycosyltransferase [Candidatus Pelagibacter sp.]|nr:glycosyltransferase [Candidatus Pelagibacter sp.]
MLISSLSGGGAERVCVNLANSLVEMGWHIDLVVLNLNKAEYRNFVSDKVNLIVLGAKRARYSFLYLIKYINQKKPNKILVFNYELAVILIIMRILFRFRTKIIARNINTFSEIYNKDIKLDFFTRYVIKPLVQIFYFKADHIVNQCNAMQEDLLKLNHKVKKKSSVIYNPISKQIDDYILTHDLNKVEKQDYLLCVGRLEKQKSFNYAIEGFAGIINDFPNLRLKIVGQGSLEQELKQKANKLCVLDRIDFEGFQKNVIPYYLHARATILTSIYEGYPNILVESISLGTPVIAFNCPSGPNEIIQEERNGYLVDHLNVEVLKSKLKILLTKKFDRDDIIATAKKNKIKHVSKLYGELINSFV